MAAPGKGLWLRWSWRELRRRWLLVGAIGLLLAGGSGLFAGLGSMRDWRVASNDASFSALAVHDLRVELTQGGLVRQRSLSRAARAIPSAGGIDAVSERIVVPTQLRAESSDGGEVLTPGRIVGSGSVEGPSSAGGLEATGGPVDGVAVDSGRIPHSTGRPEILLEAEYAKLNELETGTPVELSGGRSATAVGSARSPEYFVVAGDGAQFSAEKSFGVVFAPLRQAQRLAGRPGLVNDLVITLRPGADREAVGAELATALDRRLGDVGFELSDRGEIFSRRILYDDAENDQQLFDLFAILVLLGAAFGSMNLISRTVEAQRREIGIGMALGVSPGWLALRPLLLGAQIALVGAVLGVGLGLAFNRWLRGLLVELLPLPVLETPFQLSTFARGALVALLLPMLAAAWPVWRGVRVRPVEAMRTGFRATRGSGLARLLNSVPGPRGTLARMPGRNVLRAPRRSALTALGAGAVIAVSVSMSGMVDSFAATVDRIEAEEVRPEGRLAAELDRFRSPDSRAVARVRAAAEVADSDNLLRVAGELAAGGEPIDVVVEASEGSRSVWSPRVSAGSPPEGRREVLIAEKAAEDLGVAPGGEVELIHPYLRADGRVSRKSTTLVVSGTHPDPIRLNAFIADRGALGAVDAVNALDVVTPPSTPAAAAERALFELPGVASIASPSDRVDSFRRGLDQFVQVLGVITTVALVLVLLIAFNAAAINADERARETATMLAFGVSTGRVIATFVAESLIVGVVATLVGLGVGTGILFWLTEVNVEEILPDLGVAVSLSPLSIATAALAGAGAMGLAPLLTRRRVRRMDVPAKLRVVE